MRVEFLLTNVTEVSHFTPIGKALQALGAVVTMAPAHSRHLATQFGWSDFEAVVAAIEREGFKATGPDKTAEVIICTFPTQSLRSFYSGITVRMQYGVGLVDPKSDHPMGEESDYYLVHGPFGVRTQFTMHGMPSPLIPWERVKVIGYPKLDRWWRRSAETRIAGHRNILWLPTWSVRSSIDRYIDAIDALQSDTCHIWVKPHHCTEKWESGRMEKLRRFAVLETTTDSINIYGATDLILADLSSGAFTEALLIGKPVVGLSNPEEIRHLLLDHFYGIPVLLGPKDINSNVASMPSLGGAKQALVDDLFTTTRGHDAEVAAKIIMELQ